MSYESLKNKIAKIYERTDCYTVESPFSPCVLKKQGYLLWLDDFFLLFKKKVYVQPLNILNFALCNFIQHSYGWS